MTSERGSNQVLIVAPIGRDAELICHHLEAAGLPCTVCDDVASLCEAMGDETGAILVTEDALPLNAMQRLAAALDCQPAWSEIPVMILTGLPDIEVKVRSFRELERRTSVTLVDRPVRIKSLISTAQSVVSARQRQYQIRDLMKKLEERVHERDRFLAILGHELRNPLGAILLASQMVEDDGGLDREHAQLIERQSRHLTRIVNDLLDLSRVVSGKIVLKPQLVDLRTSVQQVLQVVEESWRAQNLTVEVRAPEEPVPSLADPIRLEQIVANMLTNAIKYTPAGGHIIISIEAAGDRAMIRIKDDGVGIAADRVGQIFELFAQAENAIGRAQGGMGIGLALVKTLVELHGGTIDVHSDGIGHGSEFVASFPLVNDPGALATRPDQPQPEADSDPHLHRSIVIVEDNADVRELLRLKLHRLGHDVDAVGDGLDGVQVIIDRRPDMALVDIGLPGLDGYGVASRVRESVGRDVVLIAVSGFGQPEDKRKALEAGFDEHITKPADVHDIENLLRRFPPRNSLPRQGV